MSNYKFLNPTVLKPGVTLKNAVVMAPMTTKSSFYDGTISNDEIDYYRERSGSGLVITAVANIDVNGKGFEGELSVAEDRFIPGLTKLANAIKSKGSKAILQIFSAGRMTNSKILRGETPYSASAVAAPRNNAEVPRTLESQEIEQLIVEFGQATKRAIIAGFDGVELHGANTYLLQQFFSPHSNRRNDEWGGSLENRMKFPLSVIAEVEKIIAEFADPDFIIGYRISPEEIEKPGIQVNDTLTLIDRISESPVDYIHTSMGHFKQSSINDTNDRQPLNEKILDIVHKRKPVIVVGSIETPEDVENALDMGATLAAIGREFIREPLWIDKVISNDIDSIRYNISPNEMDELKIPRGLQYSLLTEFKEIMNFTAVTSHSDFMNQPTLRKNWLKFKNYVSK